MSIEAFREAIVTPLKKSIDNHRNVNLSQFRSRDDVNRQWDLAVGMELALNHVESTYAAMLQASVTDTPANVEILPPQN